MKRLTIVFLLGLLFLSACTDKAEKLERQIADLVKEIKTDGKLDEDKVVRLIGLYETFITEFPEKEQTVKYLEMQAKYYSALNEFDKALNNYNRIYKEFTEYDKRGDAVFMMAFINEVNLSNLKAAEQYYKLYLKEFPDGELADDALFSLENLYLTPEQLLEKFMQMNAEESDEAPEV
jgi:tetratricopeptide (TPR) repeat protein